MEKAWYRSTLQTYKSGNHRFYRSAALLIKRQSPPAQWAAYGHTSNVLECSFLAVEEIVIRASHAVNPAVYFDAHGRFFSDEKVRVLFVLIWALDHDRLLQEWFNRSG
jgi:hypothetical protein